MYGNPYLQVFNNERIDSEIKRLEQMKEQNNRVQPIQNIINTQTQPVCEFEARLANEKDNPKEIIIQRKTAFIDLKKGLLTIKELNGEIQEYPIVLPKDEKDLEIEKLKKQIEEMKNNGYKHNNAADEITEPNAINNGNDDTTTKSSSRNISKKAE